jgi:uncharacterized RDD family membrane protein YckC
LLFLFVLGTGDHALAVSSPTGTLSWSLFSLLPFSLLLFSLLRRYSMQAQQMQTPQAQVQPKSQYAGVGVRFLAILIDVVILGVIGGLLSFVFRNTPGLLGGLTSLLVFVYYIVMEATRGATVGKMALGLRVVKTDGSSISWSESLVRNLLRIIDGLFGYLVGAILIWTSPMHQRLGDRAAHTVVVRRRA